MRSESNKTAPSVNAAICYNEHGNEQSHPYTNGLEDCKKALELSNPDSWAAFQYQGLTDFINGNYEQAVISWEKSIERNANVKEDLQPWIEKAKAKLNK